jgi:LL-diaminopimelate aminotransferase
MAQRFGVELDPETEVTALIGSKEGIVNLPTIYLNVGDIVLVPSPGYPPYVKGTLLAGGEPYSMPLTRENNFLPDLAAIPAAIAERAKILYLNYPNNPTGAVANIDFWQSVVAFAKRYNIIVASDLTYCEHYEGCPPSSLLQVEGGRDVGIEFYSLSKTYNMAGWRIGWAAGNTELIAGLRRLKAHIDNGIFPAVQHAAIAALVGEQACVAALRAVYSKRRKIITNGLTKLGWDVACSASGLGVWAAIPGQKDSMTFAIELFSQTGIAFMPGVAFGQEGEGYVRIALTEDERVLEEVIQRLSSAKY